ncbi:TetR/AcrR family transcriptional regulator [Bacillus cereus]|uniref:Forespore capture DNA-binding protein RefZ n=1 Tax=Bacillus arachidis TaxID=2819290 RepID=A0ABS3NWG7_9BACI|nr:MULTISPECIES: forespore capture DNA-binding protein RefZ [Bacillus]PGX97717.1 TetR/AcrR family transcriptional regulator [Bacillus cereus]MBO1625282.1 forespore capture DNA-binding protein RefZ [Bacillus arachidis]PFE03608.1 TetR/AcrR family transcriptional regulator [Bacillus sp. AFS023182]WIY60632.1 forespore capture DNA-binding protein RefZ [Bacillus arachidis]SDY58852.1 DNA-binding transcriptional regulator, AcrR family [Bacillus sp. 166amftsu]
MKQTKQKVIDAAISLFYTKGYDGTSVRDIAKRANVNVANISYYFAGKKGLLEQLITDFLEGYIGVIERAFEQREYLPAKEVLNQIVRGILRYQFEHRELTRFFYRELSLDTTLIREVMTVYFSKERYYIEQIIKQGQMQQEFQKVSFTMFMTQLKGMINMPYLYPQYITEVLHSFPSETFFLEMYTKEVEQWMEQTLCRLHMYYPLPRAVHM